MERSFEEKQLSMNLIELDILSESITGELDLIYKELERKGKWSDFVENLEKAPAKKESYPMTDAVPENYYECLLLALTIIDRCDEFRTIVETAEKENKLFHGELEDIEFPVELLDHLKAVGISVGQDIPEESPEDNKNYLDKICVFYLSSHKLIEGMNKALTIIRESKSYIFMNY